MSDKIKVSATVIPRSTENSGGAGKRYLFVDVALNPYLTESKDSLSYYHEIMQWWRYKEIFRQPIGFKFSIFSDDWKRVENLGPLAGVQVPDEHVAEITSSSGGTDMAVALWNSMFNEKTFVIGWNLDEKPYDIAAKLSSRELSQAIVAEIDRLIDEILLDPHRTADDTSLAFYLTDLRQRPDLVNQIVADPVISASTSRRLRRYYSLIKEFIDRYDTQLQDLYLDITVREQKSRNVDNTAEFHKKFSGYSNHPFLLRQTGWNWRYKIDITSVYDKLKEQALDTTCEPGDFKKRLFVSIDTDNADNYHKPLAEVEGGAAGGRLHSAFYISFLNEVKFLYPLTALELYKDEGEIRHVHIGRKQGKEDKEELFLKLDPRSRYVEIVDSSTKHLHASVVDRHRFLERVEKQYKTNQQNAANEVVSGEQDRQNRDLGEAVENERKAAKKNFEEGGAAEYTNTGITIALENYDQVVKTTVNNTPVVPLNELKAAGIRRLEGTGMIYLHNLVAGYRVDVAGFNALRGNSNGSFFFSSLCEKQEYYYIRDRTSTDCIKFLGYQDGTREEGWLCASAQASNSGKLYIDQELAKWNNWSLVCMRLGDNRNYINPPPEDASSILYIAVVPPEQSMTPQRFGWKYSFALRPADICGGGPRPLHETRADPSEEQYRKGMVEDLKAYLAGAAGTNQHCIQNLWSDPVLFQRVDAVPGPALAFDHAIFRSKGFNLLSSDKQEGVDAVPEWLSERWGEDLLTLVIRSYPHNGKLVVDARATSSSRLAGPPHASLDFVVQHGAIDNILINSAAMIPYEETEELRKQLFEMANRKDSDSVYETRGGREEIDYLYDPLADGLVLEPATETRSPIALGWGMFTASSGLQFDYLKGCYWKDGGNWQSKKANRLFRITLSSVNPTGELGGIDFGVDKEYTVSGGQVSLRAGTQVSMGLRCLVQEKKGPVRIFHPGVPTARTVTMQLVHAVPKPCLVTTKYYNSQLIFKELIDRATFTMRRFAERSDAIINITFEKFPVRTAESYHLHIQSIDLVGDKTTALGYRFVTQERIIKSNILPADNHNELNVVFENIDHSFDSTIHRHANYRVEAVSKFKKYFDPRRFQGEYAFSVFGILRSDFVAPKEIDQIRTVADYNKFVKQRQWQPVPSTKPPEKPAIEKTVPLFDWEISANKCERFCHRVRIYLEDWYSSGVNEKLVVFFLDEFHSTHRFNSANVLYIDEKGFPTSLQGLISQWGLDPASGDTRPVQLINPDFFEQSWPANNTLPRIPVAELRFSKSSTVETEDLFENLFVQALTFDVSFLSMDDLNREREQQFGVDAEKATEGKYYVDIPIKTMHVRDHYFPFLRLAIARYQENALLTRTGSARLGGLSPYYQFSEIVLTDFIQLPPYRKIEFGATDLVYHAPSQRKPDPVAKQNRNVVLVLGEQKDRVDMGPEEKGQIYDVREEITNNEQVRIYQLDSELTIKNYQQGFKAINILEYENYAEKGPADNHEYVDAPSTNALDPRNDHKKRLIFSYTKTF